MTNLHKFGIPTDHTILHGNRYFVSAPNLGKFLNEESTLLRHHVKSLVKTHNLDIDNEVKFLNTESYKDTWFISEELIYLIIMTRPNCQRTTELRLKFAQILWSSNLTMTLPFPKDQIEKIILTTDKAIKDLHFLSYELEKSISG